MVANTPFADYAIHNKFVQDTSTFIEKKTASAKFTFTFIYENETFGVWFDYQNCKVFVSSDYQKDSPYSFSCTLADHRENTMLLKSARKYTCWRNFIENYQLR